jgi:hypothetical protein
MGQESSKHAAYSLGTLYLVYMWVYKVAAIMVVGYSGKSTL